MKGEKKSKLQRAYLGKLSSLLSSSEQSYLYNAFLEGNTKILRMSRYESSAFDTSWIDNIESVIFDLGEIINAPKITTVEEGNIVPIELAKKINGESARHLASHTQYIKDVLPTGDVIPSKILSFSGEDFLFTYENRFIATFVRKLVSFVEMRYEFMEKYIPLHKEEALLVKNRSRIDGATVEIETKIKVTSLTEDVEAETARKALERIKIVREYLLYYFTSPFMQKMKSERNVRQPIHLTNIIRKNPKYHKCYEVFMFIDKYESLGMDYHSEETFHDLSEDEISRLNWALYSQFMALEDNSVIAPAKIRKLSSKPKIVTSIDEEEFLYGRLPSNKLEFVRVDEEYQKHLARRANRELAKNPKAQIKRFYKEEYEDKRLSKEQLEEIQKLLNRKKLAAEKFEKAILDIIALREKEEALMRQLEEEERIESEERILTKKRQEIEEAASMYGEEEGIYEQTEEELRKKEEEEEEERARRAAIEAEENAATLAALDAKHALEEEKRKARREAEEARRKEEEEKAALEHKDEPTSEEENIESSENNEPVDENLIEKEFEEELEGIISPEAFNDKVEEANIDTEGESIPSEESEEQAEEDATLLAEGQEETASAAEGEPASEETQEGEEGTTASEKGVAATETGEAASTEETPVEEGVTAESDNATAKNIEEGANEVTGSEETATTEENGEQVSATGEATTPEGEEIIAAPSEEGATSEGTTEECAKEAEHEGENVTEPTAISAATGEPVSNEAPKEALEPSATGEAGSSTDGSTTIIPTILPIGEGGATTEETSDVEDKGTAEEVAVVEDAAPVQEEEGHITEIETEPIAATSEEASTGHGKIRKAYRNDIHIRLKRKKNAEPNEKKEDEHIKVFVEEEKPSEEATLIVPNDEPINNEEAPVEENNGVLEGKSEENAAEPIDLTVSPTYISEEKKENEEEKSNEEVDSSPIKDKPIEDAEPKGKENNEALEENEPETPVEPASFETESEERQEEPEELPDGEVTDETPVEEAPVEEENVPEEPVEETIAPEEPKEEETAPELPIEEEPLEETNVEPINDEPKEEPVIESEIESSEPEPVIEEESKEEEPLETPTIESEPSIEEKEETSSEEPKEEPIETPTQKEEEKPAPVEHKPYKVAPKLNLGGKKDNKQDNKPKEKHTHAPVKHDFVDYNDAPGRFIIKCPQGYFVSDNKFSKDKGDAQVFYNFNKANRYKKLYGGKVVKL